jgi:ABC-type branched-subunit amino acid transport system substrate-binding protein
VNAAGGIYQRRLDVEFFTDVSSATASSVLRNMRTDTLFALFASQVSGFESEINQFARDRGIPVVAAFTPRPILESPPNKYVFYLFPGIETQAKALLGFVRETSVDIDKIRIVVADNKQVAGSWRGDYQSLSFDENQPQAFVASLKEAGIEAIVLIGAPDTASLLIDSALAIQYQPSLLLPAVAVNANVLATATRFGGRIFVAMPRLPDDYQADALSQYNKLQEHYVLPEEYINIQLQMLAAAVLLEEAMTRSGRELSRPKLVAALEGLYKFDTRFTRPVTYSANRRLGISGAYVVEVELAQKTLSREVQWISIDQ